MNKKTLLIIEIGVLVVGVVGGVLMLAASIMLAPDNAMYDYYQNTTRQALGWLLCFAPSVLIILAATAYFLRRKLAILEYVSVAVAFLGALLPAFYFISTSTLPTLIYVGQLIGIAFVAAMLSLSLVGKKR